MDIRNIYEAWAQGSSVSPEVTETRSSEDGVVREGFCFFFFFLAVEKSDRVRSNEYRGSRLLIPVDGLGAIVAVWKGAVMLEVIVSIPKLNRFLWAEAVTLNSRAFALGMGNGWQLRRGGNFFAEIGPEPYIFCAWTYILRLTVGL